MKSNGRSFLAAAALVAAATFIPMAASAHCDGLDGPVIRDARKALETGDAAPALRWVRAGDERELRHMLEHAVSLRKLGPEAKAVSERLFFETLVRLHRAGEGAPYTGLKPAGRDLGPVIPAADAAVDGASPEKLEKLLVSAVKDGLARRLALVRERRAHRDESVEAGRAYVAAYVDFVHYAEGVEKAAEGGHAHAAVAQEESHGGAAAAHAH